MFYAMLSELRSLRAVRFGISGRVCNDRIAIIVCSTYRYATRKCFSGKVSVLSTCETDMINAFHCDVFTAFVSVTDVNEVVC